MKKANNILSLFFGLIVLVALLLQSIHAIHHIDESFKEKKCQHIYAKSATEITHSHHNFENCFTCEFTFNSSLELDAVIFPLLHNSFYFKPSFLNTSESILFFSGSTFSLRGPPIV